MRRELWKLAGLKGAGRENSLYLPVIDKEYENRPRTLFFAFLSSQDNLLADIKNLNGIMAPAYLWASSDEERSMATEYDGNELYDRANWGHTL